ncbi:MAG: hypothetical protein Q9195_008730 [Heterodermia aff. obscurata]
MDRSIVQALTGLIPTLSGPLPPELVELAISLLAQSRNKASNLKAEEEIARLKLSLGLPKIEPRPPCPPRIYQKLYKYLDTVLTAGARRSGRAARAREATSTPTSSPAKPRTPAKAAQPKSATPRRNPNSHRAIAEGVPQWVMPTIRHLCRALGAPAAPHHVLAGVSSILTLPAPRSDDKAASFGEPENANISALIIVVYLLVITRLNGSEMSAQEFTRLRGLAITAIRESGIKETIDEVADSDKVVACVQSWMREIGSKGWTELDWFANVIEGGGLGTLEPDAEEIVESDPDDEAGNDQVANSIFGTMNAHSDDEDMNILRPGLGTMMQDRVDFLSESRMREYQAWKKDILLRCDEIENARKMDEAGD